MRKVAHVDLNTAISDGKKLPEELLSELKKHAWERNFYGGSDPAMKDENYIEQ